MENFLLEITKKSGDFLMEKFKKREELFLVRKRSKDVVTEYDKKNDQLILEEIARKFPSHGVLAEESGFNKKDSDYLWIVDSLDGSGNFANGNPLFSVCIAISYKGEVVLGSVYAPAIDEFYFAKKGEGVFLNSKKIKVSENKKVEDSYLFFCDGYVKDKKNLAQKVSQIFERAIDFRKIGSAGVELGWVASGRGDGFIIFEGDPWDVAAGKLLVEEAGGLVTDFNGDRWSPKRGSYVFSNGKIHDELLGLAFKDEK